MSEPRAPREERASLLRTSVANANPFAPVRLSPVAVNGCAVPQVGVEILNDEGGWEALNIHSQGYQLIPNTLVQQAAREITSRSSMSWTEEKTIWTGRFLSILYRSDRMIQLPEVGDAVSLGLRVENSYDGSAKFRLALMAFVLSCRNGLMSPRLFTTYTVKHDTAKEFDIEEAVGILNSGVEALEVLAPRIAGLSRMPLTVKRLSSVSRNIELPNRDWGHVLQQLEPARTMWDLMQAITHRVTHNTRGRSLITTSEEVGDYFLSRLAA
ncbi:MAG: DUF932 domain-containing protein [Methanothrix sp.]|nr:DUF932 domain-containing protein [Methanothrix sp.]